MNFSGPQHRTDGTPFRDTKMPKRLVPVALHTLRLHQLPGEVVLGLFAVTRLRRSVTTLAVTNQRLITLGDEHVGLPVVDVVQRSEVDEVHVERTKMWSTGAVTAHTLAGEINLGTLTYGKHTFNHFEEVLRMPSHTLPVIPVNAPGDIGESPGQGRIGSAPVEDGPVQPTPMGMAGTHPLIVHLNALADLHERGALTDAEFSAAKAKLLADPHGQ